MIRYYLLLLSVIIYDLKLILPPQKICFGYQGIIFNGKKGLTFSQIVLVRLEGGDPPTPPQSGQPDRFFTVFF